ncbi:MAG TPA: hypothetical protein VM577_09115 [Anaerovoracaceae bacterium]|nr:hypothetical protein [Anaerovoracaceae bacterium]
MRLNADLEEIFTLAYKTDPIKTDYHLMRVVLALPDDIEIFAGRSGRNEYELDELPVYMENPDKANILKLLSRLRSEKK